MAPLPPPPPARIPPPPPPPSAAASDAWVSHTYDHSVSTWGIGDALISMLIFFVMSFALGFLALGVGGGDLNGAWLPTAVVVPALIQFGYVAWVANARGRGLAKDLQFRIRFSDIATGAGICLVGLILAGITATAIFHLFDQEPTATAAELLQDAEGESGLTIWIYLMAILAATVIPIVEEVVFRGLWWSAFEKRGMHPVLTLTVTSAIFAVVHLEPIRTPVLFVLGMAIGLGRLVTGRVAASIAAHMYVNSIAMIFLLIELS
jgi:membrane protease YdiL (CAAX protease family)